MMSVSSELVRLLLSDDDDEDEEVGGVGDVRLVLDVVDAVVDSTLVGVDEFDVDVDVFSVFGRFSLHISVFGVGTGIGGKALDIGVKCDFICPFINVLHLYLIRIRFKMFLFCTKSSFIKQNSLEFIILFYTFCYNLVYSNQDIRK